LRFKNGNGYREEILRFLTENKRSQRWLNRTLGKKSAGYMNAILSGKLKLSKKTACAMADLFYGDAGSKLMFKAVVALERSTILEPAEKKKIVSRLS